MEFIVSADKPDEFFFMEMNTRLQVEHPVTEMVTGLDLVEWQVRVAAGEKLAFSQSDITLTGHAIEARVYAEDPGRGFLPTGGRVVDLVEPSGSGVRVDSGLLAGTVVGSDYDPMLSKVIAHAPDRAGALRKLDRALGDTAVLGVVTNIEFARFLLADPDVIAGNLDTGLLDRRVEDFVAADASDEVLIAAAAYRWLSRWTTSESVDPWDVPEWVARRNSRSDQHQALRRHPNGARCDRRRSRGCKGRGRRFTASRIQRDPDGIRTGGGDRRTSTHVCRRRDRWWSVAGRRRNLARARGCRSQRSR